MEGYSELASGEDLLGFLGVGLTAWDIWSTATSDYNAGHGYDRTIHESEVQAAGWVGAYLGGEAGAAYGAALGLEFGPEGAVVGGAIGGLVGSIVGFTYGAQAVQDWG